MLLEDRLILPVISTPRFAVPRFGSKAANETASKPGDYSDVAGLLNGGARYREITFSAAYSLVAAEP
jgi:hypothetical protein